MPGAILFLEDDADFAESIAGVLRSSGYHVDLANRIGEAVPLLRKKRYDAILSDINLPDSSGLDVLEKLRIGEAPPPVVLITGSSTFDRAIQATLLGAFDYLRKPIERGQLLTVIEKAVVSGDLFRRTAALPEAGEAAEEGAIVGQSPAMIHLFKEIGRVARQRTPVLILGETGTGKELVARAIHRYGGLREKPFVPINCAAIPETLVESELFGHEKGTFTGAQARRIGRFQEADGGVIFLDEIGELPLSIQAKLLRVLQDRQVQPLGGAAVKIDVLVVAATHRNLEAEIQAGRFREDLYFRLNLATLTLPPLRERREDIPHLIAHFLRHQAALLGGTPLAITTEALRHLEEQLWPGNVRELENVVKRASMLTSSGVIGLDQIWAALLRGGGGDNREADRADFLEKFIREYLQLIAKYPASTAPLLQVLERRAIATVLRLTKGQKIQAARILGINRKTLREKIVLYSLDEPSEETEKL